MFGFSWSFMAFGGLYFLASIADNKYQLDIILLLKSFGLFLLFGFVMFLASLWRYFMVSLGRERLMKTIFRRQDDKSLK